MLTYHELCKTKPSNKFVIEHSHEYQVIEMNCRYKEVTRYETSEGYIVVEYKRLKEVTRDRILSSLAIMFVNGHSSQIGGYSSSELIFDDKDWMNARISGVHIRSIEYFIRRNGRGITPQQLVELLKHYKHLPSDYQIKDDKAKVPVKTIQ
ncbi:MAG: hypothetical protein RM049_07365 [Nostoc sp. DedQUE04]|uniref:hypothetical protein n=1 Tax=Nostoc sp. DedQUE04 TaxID=3075390 RepID=UPI002AD2CFD3|nr:hypothetical protein [Nostoc sp. DedQUE04]MDZ8135108.1 hypothetical protein [Nostoc sp. DedQUE04]